ncbi:DUF4012 domain-containing protein [Microbacterium horticulturae]|uniref:DUF4012 domain-containing protein n=1 Tax=Microbacterium horticulturae TaxID=3028316 RepID=A0ABY8BUP0_9MICO|nr:DUF4012 domain-containing protein [Microbacterium sp. KACC 23027]WEG07889.1 DUF4012 domain-containing protein [Microbacterium sp. KACC 23027]
MPKTPPTGRHRVDRTGHHAVMRRRRWPWITASVVVGVLGVFAAITAVFAVQAITVKNDLMSAKSQITSIMSYVKKGESAKITAAGDKIMALTRDANATVQGPLWEIASGIPLVGQNVDAVRKATEATNIVVEGALPAGVKMLSALKIDSMSVSGGGVDLGPVEEAAKSLPEINATFAEAKKKLDGVDRTKILPVVDNAIGSLFDIMDDAGPALEQVQHYLPTILSVAGADEKRTYMLVFQNNAEIRAAGGLPAATAIVDVDNGHIKLREQTSTYSFRRDLKVIDPPWETQALYEDDTFTGFGNFTRTPNFPTTAAAFDSLWNITTGEHLDGLIMLDPVVLSHVLKVTGPIKTADKRTLTSDNVVEALLYDAYSRYKGNSAQDAFFSDVAARVFKKLSSGDWDVMDMLDQLQVSIKEDRLKAWFADDAEEAMSTELGMDGTLTADNKKTTQVGIYLNDSAYSKLEYFLKTKVSVTCDVDAGTMTTSITMANSVPSEGMTKYQLGIRNKRYLIPRQDFVLDVMYFAPPGSEITASDPAYGDAWDGARSGSEDSHQGKVMRIFVGQNETRTVSYTSTIPKGERGPVSVDTSPTVTTTQVSISKTCGGIVNAK